jgi:hypothetical protein
VLWRRAPQDEQGLTPRFRIDAVLKDDGSSRPIAAAGSREAAAAIADAADEDLAILTKREFDARYGLSED